MEKTMDNMWINPKSRDKEGRNVSHKSIMIVDDEPMIATLLKRIIEKKGYTATACTSPVEALTLAQTTRPGLIISDFNLPGTSDGVDLCIDIRNSIDHDVPVIIISGQSRNEKKSRQRGFEFIPKPIDQMTLLDMVDQYLQPDMRLPN